jgi:hypothetical protein
MEKRAEFENRREEKEELKVMLVGGSQFRRLKVEMERKGKGVSVVGMVGTKGRMDEETVSIALRELAGMGEMPDKIVIGGPGNSLMAHGMEGERGFWPERKVTVVTHDETGETEMRVGYHMTEPKRIAMSDRRDLVDSTVKLVGDMLEYSPNADIVYVTMFPRHVEVCCGEHMTGEDVVVMDSVRRDVDRDIVDMLSDMGGQVKVVEWWELVGQLRDLTVTETRTKGIVDSDGVHLSEWANRHAAQVLCDRLAGRERTNNSGGGGQGEGIVKKARWMERRM